MQASACVVLPPVSTLLSQLKPLSGSEDEGKTADAPESATSQKCKNLYDEIKQQDSEKILNGDSESEWGAEIAAEIRCSPCACQNPLMAVTPLELMICFLYFTPTSTTLQCSLPGIMSLQPQIALSPSCFLVFMEFIEKDGLHGPVGTNTLSVPHCYIANPLRPSQIRP